MRINKVSDKIKLTFYLRDHSAEEFNSAELIGTNQLQIGGFRLKRLSPQLPVEKPIEDFYKLASADKPYIEELNKTTLILRIPTFNHSAKKRHRAYYCKP